MKEAQYYIFNQSRLLIRYTDNICRPYIDFDSLPAFAESESVHLFGETDNVLYFVGESSQEQLPAEYKWVGLRESYTILSHSDYQLAGKASEILYFDLQHRYCGCCGAPMQWHTPISKHCTKCGEERWPKLSTAIIVLIHKGEEALLVKAKSFKRSFYGLVAGFVETGESLEECVAREVREETGLEITDIRYYGSQPWPYPMGLMVGFHANYANGHIQLLDGELQAAAFFNRNHLPDIPEKLSMARMLIDDWLQEKGTTADGTIETST